MTESLYFERPRRLSLPRAALRNAIAIRNLYWLILILFILVALLASLIAPFSPIRADLSATLLPPSRAHFFGTDQNGMDIYSRVLWATRTDFSISIIGVVLGIGIGVPLGAISGYLGGMSDEFLNRFFEMLQSMPIFLFALMVFAALGNSHTVLTGLIAFANAPKFMKLTRSVVLPLRSSDFIAAARCGGLGTPAVIVRHIIPNSLAPVLSQLAIQCAYAIQLVAGLSFLGFGVRIPEPEWGSMIQLGAARIIYGQWWPSLFPGLAVVLAVIAFGGIGRQLSRWYGERSDM